MAMSVEKPTLLATTMLVAALYAGVLVGCSFLATSAKFLAPSLTLPVALDVGRHTFRILLMVEWVLALTLLVLTWLTCGSWRRGMIVALVLILALEYFWLLPILDVRVTRILAGHEVPPSPHHLFYIAGDTLKVLLLLALAASLAWSRAPVAGHAGSQRRAMTDQSPSLRTTVDPSRRA